MDTKEIQNLIKELIEHFTTISGEIEVLEHPKSKSLWYKVNVKDPYFFINKEGEALSAFNYIVKRIVDSKNFPKDSDNNEKPEQNINFLIDINDFQKKKIENIEALVHMMAERARYFKSNIEIDPMPAFERRIAHEFLSDATDLKTESEGVGHKRRVVIKYIGSI